MSINEITAEINRVFTSEIEALESAKFRIGAEFSQAVELIASANKIILSGVGKSGLIAGKSEQHYRVLVYHQHFCIQLKLYMEISV